MRFLINSWAKCVSINNELQMENLIKKIEDKAEQLKEQDIFIDKTEMYTYVGKLLNK